MYKAIIKINQSDENMKACGIYAGGLYYVCGGQIENERKEMVNISWWNMNYETIEVL